MADRLCLQGILYVLHNDIAWQLLPLELGFGSGQTCWRRLDRWQQAGVFDQLHRILLAELNAAGGHPTQEFIEFIEKNGGTFEEAAAARQAASGDHNRRATPLFAASIARHAQARTL